MDEITRTEKAVYSVRRKRQSVKQSKYMDDELVREAMQNG